MVYFRLYIYWYTYVRVYVFLYSSFPFAVRIHVVMCAYVYVLSGQYYQQTDAVTHFDYVCPCVHMFSCVRMSVFSYAYNNVNVILNMIFHRRTRLMIYLSDQLRHADHLGYIKGIIEMSILGQWTFKITDGYFGVFQDLIDGKPSTPCHSQTITSTQVLLSNKFPKDLNTDKAMTIYKQETLIG